MNNVLKIEEIALFIAGIYFFSLLPFAWWIFLLLLLLPDIGILGYLISPGIGSLTYNLLHHRGVALLVWGVGVWCTNDMFQLAGIILFSHAAMDRFLGYGLKYSDSFWHTHLGMIPNFLERKK